ncbi:MAG: hypothetical protein Q8M03_10050 [Legionella sp.]|nr:hypothetical protein [Legionella sp.]
MNKRLVWNFEINNEPPLDFSSLPEDDSEEIRWEARYFWGSDTIITLHGLDDKFFNIALFESKERRDRYYLLPNLDYNIKVRRDELFYKPLLIKERACQAFGKKINLSTHPASDTLPGLPAITVDKLLDLINTESENVYVEKVALIYKFDTNPRIKLELARLKIADTIYFSACIEGRSKQLVTLISKHVFPKTPTGDYVHFLKEKSA